MNANVFYGRVVISMWLLLFSYSAITYYSCVSSFISLSSIIQTVCVICSETHFVVCLRHTVAINIFMMNNNILIFSA